MPKGAYERAAKEYQRPTITSILLHLRVGEYAIFPALDGDAEAVMKNTSTTWNQRRELWGRKYRNEKYLLVRDGEIARPVVVVTREE